MSNELTQRCRSCAVPAKAGDAACWLCGRLFPLPGLDAPASGPAAGSVPDIPAGYEVPPRKRSVAFAVAGMVGVCIGGGGLALAVGAWLRPPPGAGLAGMLAISAGVGGFGLLLGIGMAAGVYRALLRRFARPMVWPLPVPRDAPPGND